MASTICVVANIKFFFSRFSHNTDRRFTVLETIMTFLFGHQRARIRTGPSEPLQIKIHGQIAIEAVKHIESNIVLL